ncbi:MAG: Trk system potassium transporter TrkA [Verrucomicrobiota bacterium]
MKLVVVGAGEVGSYLSAQLSEQGHDVTVIEQNPETCRQLDEMLNVRVVRGNGSSASILKQAEVQHSTFFMAMTSDDQSNLIASSLAKSLGAETVIARIHDSTYADTSHFDYRAHFGIDILINPEMLSAIELAKSIRNPARVAVENFARGQIEAQRFQVDPKSKYVGRSLRDIKLPPQVKIGYITRGDEQDVPTADTVLEAGDLLTVFGGTNELYNLRAKVDPESTGQSRRVAIFGGSEVAVSLLRLLSGPRFKVRVIEKRTEKSERLAALFPNATIIQGDGTSLRLMEEEQIGSVDYFVASTSDDERNILTAVQAHKLGARHVQAIITKSDYEDILLNMRSSLGIETIVSPRVVTAKEVMRYLSKDAYVELFNFPQHSGRILEIRVAAKSAAAGKELREIEWPPHCVVVALLHEHQATVPGATDKILADDRVVVITREENIRDLLRLLRKH